MKWISQIPHGRPKFFRVCGEDSSDRDGESLSAGRRDCRCHDMHNVIRTVFGWRRDRGSGLFSSVLLRESRDGALTRSNCHLHYDRTLSKRIVAWLRGEREEKSIVKYWNTPLFPRFLFPPPFLRFSFPIVILSSRIFLHPSSRRGTPI